MPPTRVLLVGLVLGAITLPGCGESCSRAPSGLLEGGAQIGPLERDLRRLKSGGAFVHTELLEIDRATDENWSVVQAVSAESSRPMAQGSSRCRAYAFLLRRRDDVTPWGVIATFCDGDLLRSDEPRTGGQSVVTWPLMAHVEESKLDLRAQFVDAIDSEHEVLWVSEKSWSRDGGYLCAMEYVYRREGFALRKILQAVGADPASYADKSDAFNQAQAVDVRGSYESGFVGGEYPKGFRTRHLYRGEPSELMYRLDQNTGSYAWEPPGWARDR